jgi:hypothetical protein
MASSYDNELRLNEMATGDASGTWGDTTNVNLQLIAEAFSYGTEAITTNADTHTTTIADGATDPGRSMYLKYTGTLDSACTITIAPNDISKVWIIENGTSGSQNIIISQGSGANITIPAGDTKVVYSDGAGSGAAFFDAFASLSVVDLKVQDDLTVTDDLIVNGDIDLEGSIDVNGTTNLDIVDIDGAVDMASTLAVGGVVTANAGVVVDNITIDGTEIDLSSGNLTLDVAGDIILNADGGDIKFQDGGANVGSLINDSGFVIKSDVSDADIKFQGVDGVSTITALTLDMSEAGAATFSSSVTAVSLDISGDIDVDGTTNLDVVDIDGAVDMASTLTVAGDANFDSNTLFVDVSANNVGIGNAAPATPLHVTGTIGAFHSNNDNRILMSNNGTVGSINVTYGLTGPYLPLTFLTSDVERMRITSGGGVGIKTTSVDSGLNLQIGSNDGVVAAMSLRHTTVPMYLANGFDGSQGISSMSLNSQMTSNGSDTYTAARQNDNYPIVAWEVGTSTIRARYGTGATLVTKFTIASDSGNTTIAGSLSKGSGSFKIDHPLPAKTDTHHLIHSFIEGPQADNIYRGKVDLVSGSATVNIDTVAGMTEGTFVALNREVQCFTTNESNWDAVKGSVSGNILTIESENSESTATISWLVIGERKDQHMYDTDWTDDDGKVIVEPLKTDEE